MQKRLQRATLGIRGLMRETTERYPHVHTYVCMAGSELAGWCLVSHNFCLMTYVKVKYRRLGIAKKLIRRVKRDYGDNLWMELWGVRFSKKIQKQLDI